MYDIKNFLKIHFYSNISRYFSKSFIILFLIFLVTAFNIFYYNEKYFVSYPTFFSILPIFILFSNTYLDSLEIQMYRILGISKNTLYNIEIIINIIFTIVLMLLFLINYLMFFIIGIAKNIDHYTIISVNLKSILILSGICIFIFNFINNLDIFLINKNKEFKNWIYILALLLPFLANLYAIFLKSGFLDIFYHNNIFIFLLIYIILLFGTYKVNFIFNKEYFII